MLDSLLAYVGRNIRICDSKYLSPGPAKLDVRETFFWGVGGVDSKCSQVRKIVLGKWVTQVYDTLLDRAQDVDP